MTSRPLPTPLVYDCENAWKLFSPMFPSAGGFPPQRQQEKQEEQNFSRPARYS